MGGKIKKGYCIVSGVVNNDIKKYLDNQVENGMFKSRCQAIGFLITKFHKDIWKKE